MQMEDFSLLCCLEVKDRKHGRFARISSTGSFYYGKNSSWIKGGGKGEFGRKGRRGAMVWTTRDVPFFFSFFLQATWIIVDILTLICSEVIHTELFPLPPPAAVTVGKQYATPHLPSSVDVCFCERCTAICLTKPNPAARFEINGTYDDEAFWHILQCTLLCTREMEGGDPFRSLMLWARVWETAVLQSDMLELWS